VSAFLGATERGDAAAAMELCNDDFFYRTHRATTESLADAEERLHTKVPAPNEVTLELHEDLANLGTFVREIVVKPVPFITVSVRQQFEVRGLDGAMRIASAKYEKQ
jgi:hypothetical protein